MKVQERPNCNAIVAGGRNPIGKTYFAWGSLCKVHRLDDAFLIYQPVDYLPSRLPPSYLGFECRYSFFGFFSAEVI